MPPPSKKRKMAPAPEQITFDPDAREEYLTGFHKRKVARIKHAQEENAKKDREERIRARAEMRKQRKEDLEKHVSEVNRLVKQANGELFSDDSDDSDSHPDSSTDAKAKGDAFAQIEAEPIDQEDEYIDEDKYTTVTIETVGISRQGFETKADREEEEEEQKKEKRVWTKEKPKTARPKKKKIKFRYETKAERKAERVKQGVKKKKQKDARTATT